MKIEKLHEEWRMSKNAIIPQPLQRKGYILLIPIVLLKLNVFLLYVNWLEQITFSHQEEINNFFSCQTAPYWVNSNAGSLTEFLTLGVSQRAISVFPTVWHCSHLDCFSFLQLTDYNAVQPFGYLQWTK